MNSQSEIDRIRNYVNKNFKKYRISGRNSVNFYAVIAERVNMHPRSVERFFLKGTKHIRMHHYEMLKIGKKLSRINNKLNNI